MLFVRMLWLSIPIEKLIQLRLAVKYMFLTNDGLETIPELLVEPFNGTTEQNDYEVCLLLPFPTQLPHYASDTVVVTGFDCRYDTIISAGTKI